MKLRLALLLLAAAPAAALAIDPPAHRAPGHRSPAGAAPGPCRPTRGPDPACRCRRRTRTASRPLRLRRLARDRARLGAGRPRPRPRRRLARSSSSAGSAARIVAEIENQRFRAPGGTAAEQAGVRDSFAYSTLWMGDIAAETADGRLLVDVASFLTRDELGIVAGAQGGRRRRVPARPTSSASPIPIRSASSRDNIELEGRLTFTSTAPTAEVEQYRPGQRQSELRRPPLADPPARARL